MLVEEAILSDAAERCDTPFEIAVSDLRPRRRGRAGGLIPSARLSTRLRARRYVASLLTLALVALSLAPGAGVSLPGAPLVTSASARSAPPADAPDLGGDSPALWPRAPRSPDAGEEAPYAATRGHHLTPH